MNNKINKDKLTLNQHQEIENSDLIKHLSDFVDKWYSERATGNVSKGVMQTLPDRITKDPNPMNPRPLQEVIDEIYSDILPYVVKTSHPLFLGYVTPPTLDISWFGNAIIAMLNQNVSFASLSPVGTAIEKYVIQVMNEKIIGYTNISGGIFVSGGSAANLHAMLLARRYVLGQEVINKGNYTRKKPQRIYCSNQIHRSIHKAAMLMGIGIENVVEIPTDKNHKILISELEKVIKKDQSKGYVPIAIVGAAGTRTSGSFDDLKALSEIAEKEHLWFHVDGAYGAFLRIADNHPKELDYINLAHSVTIDPHKLFFMPFDSGCLLVKDNQSLLDTFATEGEYLEKYHPPGNDYTDYGMQLGRSMKAFNVWLALKYFGLNTFKKEFERLLNLASSFREIINKSGEFELVGPGESIIVCFRIKLDKKSQRFNDINLYNNEIIEELVKEGELFVNKVIIDDNFAFRIPLSNFRTRLEDLNKILEMIKLKIDG